MISIDPDKLATAFLKPGTPMIAELLLRLKCDDGDLSDTRRRDLASGLRGIARAVNQSPETVPADLGWLQPRLEKVAPAALGMTAKSWSNTLSNAKAALEHFQLAKRRVRRRGHLCPVWRDLWCQQQETTERSIGAAIGNFVFFLSAIGVAPDAVSSEHALAYRDALIENEIRKSPEETYRKTIQGWNRAVRRHSFWPQQSLTAPSRSRTIAPKLDELPASFALDLEAYLHGLVHPDPLADDGPTTPLRPATVAARRFQIMRFAGILSRTGMAFENMVSLAVLVEPAHVKRGLRWMLARRDNKSNKDIQAMASLLLTLATSFVYPDEAMIKELGTWADKLKTRRQEGMTVKNRDRLRAVNDSKTLQRLLLLPERLFARAEQGDDTPSSKLEREDAVALAILQACPIRRKNLIEIHLDRNLHRSGDGSVYLIFEEGETKTRRMIEFLLPDDVVRMIDRHVATRSPKLCPSGTRWLFPKRDGSAPTSAARMSTRISKRIRREIGIDFNMHLHRHLAAKLVLTDRPGSYEVVRRLLGHSSTSSTLNAYVGFEAGTSTKFYADVLTKARTA